MFFVTALLGAKPSALGNAAEINTKAAYAANVPVAFIIVFIVVNTKNRCTALCYYSYRHANIANRKKLQNIATVQR